MNTISASWTPPRQQAGIDGKLFRSTMRRLPAQVGVIATRSAGQRIALTATAISSLSAEPPQLLVCIHHLSRPAQLIREAGVFAVNLLSQQQRAVAQQCAISQLEPEERFAVGSWSDGPVTGAPVLDGATVTFECQLEAANQFGTHFVFVGLIVAARFSMASPLLYHDGSYCELGNHHGALSDEWNSSILGF